MHVRRTIRFPLRRSSVLLAIAALACSAQPSPNDPRTTDEPSVALPSRANGPKLPIVDDPFEPFNRSMSATNHVLISWVVRPFSTGWKWITGPAIRESCTNFFHNLRWPLHTFANLLQGEGGGAWRETARFGINTTVGILGFFDPATGWGIEAAEEDFGRVFSTWGWENSRYLVLPFFGPKTARETAALPLDLVFNIATYVPGGGTLETINAGADKLPQYFRFVRSNYDPYQRGRIVYLLDREWRSRSYEAVPARDRSVETLGAVYLSNRDPEFPPRGETRCAAIGDSGRELPYDLWLQPEPAPLVCILPGLGGHRISGSAYGLAEMAWRAGFSAVTVSNAMNWEFVKNASSVDVPGFAEQDARDVHRALGSILSDIEREHPGRVTKKGLLGISLGAFHTLFIAANDGSKDPSLPTFDAFAALNPPVRFARGLEQLDAFYLAPTTLPVEREAPWIDELLGKVVALVKKGEIEPGNMLPFSKMEAEFLIGLAFRATLAETILASQDRRNLGILRTVRDGSRTADAWVEARGFSYRDYMMQFALPYYRERDASIRNVHDLLSRCDARRFTERLRTDPRVFVFTNVNDFLLDETDLEWLNTTFGPDRLATEREGSHLGNLYREDVQATIMSRFGPMLSR